MVSYNSTEFQKLELVWNSCIVKPMERTGYVAAIGKILMILGDSFVK